MSTYITALVAGAFHVVRDEYAGPHGTYPLGVFCRTSMAPYLDADRILEETKQGFAFFEEAFGHPYPFGKYDQLFVPEYNAGAMENAGCVTLMEDYIFRSRVTEVAYESRANTILHELAHMWFGDLVTMRWWDDLWLNESFAEWASYHAMARATRYIEAWTSFRNQRKTWAYRQDQLPSTHPIATDAPDLATVKLNFDGITYAKGASALRQLVAWVGEEEFFAGLRAYFQKHMWGNTELRDLLVELERTSGRDLSTWTREWLQTPGVNLLRPDVDLRGPRHVRDRDHRPGAAADAAGAGADPAQPSHPDRALRPPRRSADAHRADRAGPGGCPHGAPAARRATRLGPHADQRRRPDVREDPPRWALLSHCDRPPRRPRPADATRPGVGCRLGHDPRRRVVRRRLPAAGAVGPSRRVRHRRGPEGAPPGAHGHRALRGSRAQGGVQAAPGRRDGCGPARRSPRQRPPTCLREDRDQRGPDPRAARPGRRACWTDPGPSRGWSSTPT